MKIGRLRHLWLVILSSLYSVTIKGFTVPSGCTSVHMLKKKWSKSMNNPHNHFPDLTCHHRLPTSISISTITAPTSSASLINTIAALFALIVSSMLGMKVEERLPSSGILTTLLVAAFLSNVIPIIPLQHVLYDLCWSRILPGSLTLLLLGFEQDQQERQTSSSQTLKEQRKEWKNTAQAVGRVAGPFVMATIGSLLGCWITFYGWNTLSSPSTTITTTMAAATKKTSTVTTNLVIQGGLESYPLRAAALSCLAASYVGGSVNLFATAKLIHAPASLLSSLAAADLIAMALYFSFLSTSLEWMWLKRLFYYPSTTTTSSPTSTEVVDNEDMAMTAPPAIQDDNVMPKENPISSSMDFVDNDDENGQITVDDGSRSTLFNGTRTTKSSPTAIATTTTSASTVSMGKEDNKNVAVVLQLLGITTMIVAFANTVESWFNRWIPGTACGFIAILTPFVRSTLTRLRRYSTRRRNPTTTDGTTRDDVSSSTTSSSSSSYARKMAEGCLLLFFASIGMGVDLKASLFLMGPECVLISTSALILHLIVTVIGTHFFLPCQSWKITLEDVWIASNAAIGGPATAAAFVTRLLTNKNDCDNTNGPGRKPAMTDNDDDPTILVQGRTMAATVWGIVGYAIGTMIGVGLYRRLTV